MKTYVAHKMIVVTKALSWQDFVHVYEWLAVVTGLSWCAVWLAVEAAKAPWRSKERAFLMTCACLVLAAQLAAMTWTVTQVWVLR